MAKEEATLLLRIKQVGAKALTSVRDNMKAIGKTALRVGAIIAGFAASALTAFGKFEAEFSKVTTLLDKSSFKTKTLEQGISGLKKGVIALSQASGESFKDLNKGLFDIISASIPAEKALMVLAVATRLAAAGGTDVATATKAIVASLSAFGNEAGTAQVIAEKFFNAQKFGITTVGELAQEFNKVAGLGKALGLSFDEILAAGTAMTNNGAKPASVAFTELRGVFNGLLQLQGRLPDLNEELAKSLSLANIQEVGFVEALKQANDTVGGNVASLQKLLPNIRGLSAVLSLTGRQAAVFNTIMTANADKTKRAATFSAALAKRQATVDFAFRRLKQSGIAFLTTVGEKLAPLFIKVSNVLISFSQKLQKNKSLLNAFVSIVSFGVKTFLFFKNLVAGVGEQIGLTMGFIVTAIEAATSGSFSKLKSAMEQFTDETHALAIERARILNEELEIIDGERRVASGAHQALLLEDQKVFADEQLKALQKSNKKQRGIEKKSQSQKRLAALGLGNFSKTLNSQEVKDKEATFNRIASLSQSNNKVLNAIGKAAAIASITINTARGVTMALGAFPPPLSFAMAGLVATAGAVQAAKAAGVQLEHGGIVSASPGGTQATIGEGGRDEAVVPLGEGGLGNTIVIQAGAFVGDETSAREFAVMVDEEMTKLRQDNESFAFDEDII